MWSRTTIITAHSLIHHSTPVQTKKGERNRACSDTDGASNLLPTMEKHHLNQRKIFFQRLGSIPLNNAWNRTTIITPLSLYHQACMETNHNQHDLSHQHAPNSHPNKIGKESNLLILAFSSKRHIKSSTTLVTIRLRKQA